VVNKKPIVLQSWIRKALYQSIDWDIECKAPCFTVGAMEAAIAAGYEEKREEDKKLISNLQEQVAILAALVDEATDAGSLDLSSGRIAMEEK